MHDREAATEATDRVPARPAAAARAHPVLALQRHAGNRATATLLQRNRSKGAAGGTAAPVQYGDTLPSVAQFKQDTKHHMRSKELKAVDRALEYFHQATEPMERQRAIEVLYKAIDAWKTEHQDSARMAIVKLLDAARSSTELKTRPAANKAWGASKAAKPYQDAIKAQDPRAAAAEAAKLAAGPSALEFTNYLQWELSPGGNETDRVRFALRYLAADHATHKHPGVIRRFVEVSELKWMQAGTTRWVWTTLIEPMRTETSFELLLQHRQLLQKLRTHDSENFRTLVQETPALQISEGVGTAQAALAPAPTPLQVADAVVAAALGGPNRLPLTYSPTGIDAGAKLLTIPRVGGDANLACHEIAPLLANALRIHAANSGQSVGEVKVHQVREALLTKPVAGMQVLPGSRGLVQQLNHPGNVLRNGAPTGQVFFAPAAGIDSHSYLSVTVAGVKRSYDPIFGIAWSGDWQANASAGVDDLYNETDDGWSATSSGATIQLIGNDGQAPFKRQFAIT